MNAAAQGILTTGFGLTDQLRGALQQEPSRLEEIRRRWQDDGEVGSFYCQRLRHEDVGWLLEEVTRLQGAMELARVALLEAQETLARLGRAS